MPDPTITAAQVEAWADRLNSLEHDARSRHLSSQERLLVEVITEMYRAAGVFNRSTAEETP